MNSTESMSDDFESSRVKVGRPGEIEFISRPMTPRAVSAKSTGRASKKNTRRGATGASGWKILGQWFLSLGKTSQLLILVFLFGVVRLFAMNDGIMDIISKRHWVEEQQLQNHSIERENADLRKEIDRIKGDRKYQRRLAREHLGVISEDEYLILFSKEGDSPK